MRAERTPRAGRYWAVVIFLGLGTLAGIWHNRQVERGRPDYLAGAVRYVIAPPARLAGKVSHWFGAETEWLTHGRSVAADNQRLRARVAELEEANASLREAQTSYDRLRADMGFVQEKGQPKIPADVIALRPDLKFDTLIIARGSGDGIKPNSVVVTKNGVVGRVFEVEPGTASVLMLTDQKSGIGARVQRAGSRVVGVCEGNNSSLLTMLGLGNDADIKVGDVIVTSGLGGVFPKGLVIGVVSDVQLDTANVGKLVHVRPRVNFDRLEEVYVLP